MRRTPRRRVAVAGTAVVALALIIAQVQAHAAPPDRTAQQLQQWWTLRTDLPRTLPVFRPTWLPARFQTAQTGFEYSTDAHAILSYGLSYAPTRDGDTQPYLSLTYGSRCSDLACPISLPAVEWTLPVRLGVLP